MGASCDGVLPDIPVKPAAGGSGHMHPLTTDRGSASRAHGSPTQKARSTTHDHRSKLGDSDNTRCTSLDNEDKWQPHLMITAP
jgi:hypothetical protein